MIIYESYHMIIISYAAYSLYVSVFGDQRCNADNATLMAYFHGCLCSKLRHRQSQVGRQSTSHCAFKIVWLTPTTGTETYLRPTHESHSQKSSQVRALFLEQAADFLFTKASESSLACKACFTTNMAAQQCAWKAFPPRDLSNEESISSNLHWLAP